MILKFNEITEMSFRLKQTFNLKNKDNLEINSRRHASVLVKKKKKVTELKKLVVSMRDIMKAEKDNIQTEKRNADLEAIDKLVTSKKIAKTLKSKEEYIGALKKRSTREKKKVRDWKHKHNALKDELAAQKDTSDCMSDEIAMLSEEIEQWKDIAGEMREHYEEAIHSLTPETFGKHWVKNIGKKGTVLE